MQSIQKAELLPLMKRCKALAIESEDSAWSSLVVKEIIEVLDRSICSLQDSKPVDVRELRFLFAPTGPLQETSMSNGWAKEFLVLAAEFDRCISETK